MHRGDHFEDPLDEALKAAGCGEVSGGGTLQTKIGEVASCDIDIAVAGPVEAAVRVVIDTLEALGVPKGSKLRVESEEREVPFGRTEGLAVYLNGSDLPDEVYRKCDSNVVYAAFEQLLGDQGRILSWWQGPTETALYLYGASFEEMRALLAGFIASYPLCQQCRVEQIA